MNRFVFPLMVFIMLFAATGCGPMLTVENKTSIPVRAIVSSGGTSQVLSPSPGESSSADMSEGPYRVFIIRDEEWLAYAKDVRSYLNNQLANSDKLTGPQLLEVIQRLKDIAARMQAFEQAGNQGTACSGIINQDHDGLVEISTSAGALVIACK